MKILLFATVLLLVCMTFPCLAEMGGPAQEESFYSPVSIKATVGGIADAKFKDSGGSSRVLIDQLSLKAGGFSLRYAGRNYSWKDTSKLNFGNGSDKPWESLHRLRLAYEHMGQINNDWFYSAEIAGTSSFEKEMSGSFGTALRGGFGYIINDNWATEFGAVVFSNSINSSILPYFGIAYENFDTDGSGYFMSLGAPSVETGYSFSKESTIRFAFSMDGTTYRLKDDSSVVKKGYLETNSMIAGLYYDWRPTDSLSLSFGPEYHFGREMKFYDKSGDKTGETIKQDSAFGGKLQIGYAF